MIAHAVPSYAHNSDYNIFPGKVTAMFSVHMSVITFMSSVVDLKGNVATYEVLYYYNKSQGS